METPRQGHLDQVISIFGHIKKYQNTEIVFDRSNPVIDETKFEKKDWTSSEFGHVDGVEELPVNMPETRGIGFTIRSKVDADHAVYTVMSR